MGRLSQGRRVHLCCSLGCRGVNFTLNKYFAFRDRSIGSRGSQPSSPLPGLVAVATAVLMAVAMQLVAVKLGVPYLLAKPDLRRRSCSSVWTYPAQRRLVFRRSAHAV